MKRVQFEDLERLELISTKLERVVTQKQNPIILDMKWLVEKLREAFNLIELEEKR